MRTAFSLFLLTLIIGFIIFVKVSSESTFIVHKYIGVDRCRGCHEVDFRGDQYNIWKKSKHYTATYLLKSEKAVKYARENNMKVPEENESCLECHTTGYGEKKDNFENSFNLWNGIQCEECHKAGSDYSKYDIMISEKKFISNGGDPGKKIKCFKCHSPNIKSNNFRKCPFQKKSFNVETAIEKIKHPVTTKILLHD